MAHPMDVLLKRLMTEEISLQDLDRLMLEAAHMAGQQKALRVKRAQARKASKPRRGAGSY